MDIMAVILDICTLQDKIQTTTKLVSAEELKGKKEIIVTLIIGFFLMGLVVLNLLSFIL